MAMVIGSASDLVGCKKSTVEGLKQLLLLLIWLHVSLFEPLKRNRNGPPFVADLAQLYQSNAAFHSSQHNSTQKGTVEKLVNILHSLKWLTWFSCLSLHVSKS